MRLLALVVQRIERGIPNPQIEVRFLAGALCLLFATALLADNKEVYTPDIDLKHAPAYYRERVIAFRNLLRKEPTQEAKVKKAVALAGDPKSPYRRDAVDFLGEVRPPNVVPDLARLAKAPDLREAALHSLGEIGDPAAMPTLIYYLMDENENVRGNAQLAIQRITRRNFSYKYDDPQPARLIGQKDIHAWWDRSQATFRRVEETSEEKKKAAEAWEKYGKNFLHDLSQ